MTTPADPPDRPADGPLVPEFEPPAREAWLALVDKVLKGGRFREAAGLAHG